MHTSHFSQLYNLWVKNTLYYFLLRFISGSDKPSKIDRQTDNGENGSISLYSVENDKKGGLGIRKIC